MENSLKTSRWSKTENRVRLDILLFHYVDVECHDIVDTF